MPYPQREPVPVVSVSPVALRAPGRGTPLQVRVSAPVSGSQLPIVVFAHGFGSSSDAYAPLASFWAARGFVVVQPTFLDSRLLALGPNDPRSSSIWRIRIDDVKQILDQLAVIEDCVPGLKGRVDANRIAAAGHSFGAQTTGLLLGAQVIHADGSPAEDFSDPRIRVGILLASAGQGGLSAFASEHFPYLNQSFANMTTPALVVAGDKDDSPLSVRGPDWFNDAYTLSPGDKSLLTLFGGEHMLGGISGDRVTETTDENPARVAVVQRVTCAYLRSALDSDDAAWTEAVRWLHESGSAQGRIENKR